jgi:UTP--glucose-1-phosphate uridylyltransferase
MQKVKKGVIPAAGLGTRLYPMTEAQPKEMLPIGGRPMIYYAVLEAALSGLEQIYIVINQRKDSLRQYLEGGGLEKDLQQEGGGQGISHLHITFVDQPFPLGSGEAIYRTREMTGEEPFALMMPDFLLFGSPPALAQMIPLCQRFKQNIVGVLSLGARDARGFSNVGVVQATQLEQGIVEVHSFSGKSKEPLLLQEGERILKLAGRWILGPHFFSYLERIKGNREEWDDATALQAMAHERKMIGKILEGQGFDVGNPLGYRAAKEEFSTLGDQIFPP